MSRYRVGSRFNLPTHRLMGRVRLLGATAWFRFAKVGGAGLCARQVLRADLEYSGDSEAGLARRHRAAPFRGGSSVTFRGVA